MRAALARFYFFPARWAQVGPILAVDLKSGSVFYMDSGSNLRAIVCFGLFHVFCKPAFFFFDMLNKLLIG